LPTPRANEPGSTSAGYGDSLNDFASRVTKGYAPKDLELLRSPKASEGSGGALGEKEALKRGNTVGVRDQVLDLMAEQGASVSRVERNLPTPTTRNDNLLGTPRTSSAHSSTKKQVSAGAPKARLEDQVHTNWGRFEAAVKRWETLIDRPAPAPTKPDGKDGNHRLSSKFTEWMMGLPDGWITDVGLSRTDELKACGNGVVPQQAFMALETLLGAKEGTNGSH